MIWAYIWVSSYIYSIGSEDILFKIIFFHILEWICSIERAFLDSYQQEQSQHAISKMSSRRIISFNLRKFSTQSTFRFTYKCQLSFIVLWNFFLTTIHCGTFWNKKFQDFWPILKSFPSLWCALNFLAFRQSKITVIFAHFLKLQNRPQYVCT